MEKDFLPSDKWQCKSDQVMVYNKCNISLKKALLLRVYKGRDITGAC